MIWTLPGFLGLPGDWDFLPWPHRTLEPVSSAPRPLSSRPLSPAPGLEPRPEEDLLIGYSMGGRLSLQLLRHYRFRKAVVISAGLNAPDPDRLARDEVWARRFESEEWSTLIRDWDAQPVFRGSQLARREEDYDRAELARQLRELSPAVLPPPNLEDITTPILWVVGERDAKYVGVARRAMDRLPHAQLWICPGAGHRVPWEQPRALVERLRLFFEMH